MHAVAVEEVQGIREGGAGPARHRVLGQLLRSAEEGAHVEAEQLGRVLGGEALRHDQRHR